MLQCQNIFTKINSHHFLIPLLVEELLWSDKVLVSTTWYLVNFITLCNLVTTCSALAPVFVEWPSNEIKFCVFDGAEVNEMTRSSEPKFQEVDMLCVGAGVFRSAVSLWLRVPECRRPRFRSETMSARAGFIGFYKRNELGIGRVGIGKWRITLRHATWL